MPETRFWLRAGPGNVAVVTIDNGADHTKPTVFDESAFRSLDALLPELEGGDWTALVVTGKPFVFAAGADMTRFVGISREDATAGSRTGHELFGRIRALPFPTVAAINGACVGGGVELALHCDARTISTAVRHFGLPEVFLGLVPGWGGTQLLPRLAGAETAVRLIVRNPLRQNRLLSGAEAVELGLADRLLAPVEFLDESIAYARELAQAGVERAAADLSDVEEVVRKARLQLDGSVHGAAPAPYRALDLVAGAARWSLEEGYRAEEEAIGDLLPGPPAQASLYAYDLVERRAKRRPGIPPAEPRQLRRVGIVGAGLMARQLAALFVRRLELPLVLRDLEQGILDDAVEHVRDELASDVAKSRLDEGRARFLASLVTTTTGWDELAGCDLVLEAVFEEVAVKKEVFAALETVVGPGCVLATNTSSLSVTELAADLDHPERVVGIHFFNPVAVLPLVELVRAEATDDATLATAATLVERLRKRPVLVADAPAFVVNRLLSRLMAVVLDAVESGTPPDEADEAILRLGLPMAPSVLLQMVGPRVALHVQETLHEAFPDRFPLSPTLAALAEGRDEPVVRDGATPRTQDEILADALEAVADEVHRLLADGVVGSAKDVDTALLLGAGWPFWLGGITKHLDQTGISQRLFGRPLAEIGSEVTA